jgi:hypothetical protein
MNNYLKLLYFDDNHKKISIVIFERTFKMVYNMYDFSKHMAAILNVLRHI